MTLIYQSTRDENNKVTASQAILQGLATDGGLFTPTSLPEVALDFDALKDASYQEVAKLVLSAFLDDFTEEELDYCINSAYDEKFDTPAIAPVVMIFVMGAIISAIAGSLYVGYIGTVVPKDFTIMKSIDYLIIAVLGGLGSITGTILAAIVLGILNMFLQNVSNLRMIIYSLALILVMIFRPGGLLGTKEFTLSRFFNKGKGGNH